MARSVALDDRKEPERGVALKSWLHRHGLQRFNRGFGACACACTVGTDMAAMSCGKLRSAFDRHGSPWRCLQRSADHAEMFRRGRRRAIWTTEPYEYDPREIWEFCKRLTLAAVRHPKSESSYYPGGTHLIAVMPSAELDEYLSLEPHAVPIVRPRLIGGGS